MVELGGVWLLNTGGRVTETEFVFIPLVFEF